MKKAIYSLLVLCLLCSSCSNPDTERAKAIDAARTELKEKPAKSNTAVGKSNIYLPKGFSAIKDGKNNWILKRDNQIYLLFILPNEPAGSRTAYELIQEQKNDYTVLETFESKKEFGYIAIKEKGEVREVSVGRGGVKLTMETSEKRYSIDVKEMMKIVHSVREQDGH